MDEHGRLIGELFSGFIQKVMGGGGGGRGGRRRMNKYTKG